MTELMDYGENQLAEALFRNGTISRPTSWFIALSTTAPNEDGTNITEPAGNYARQPVDTGASSEWDDPAGGGTTQNSLLIEFLAATVSYGSVGYVLLFDAITGGNAWFWSALDAPVTVDIGEVFRFPIGDLDIAFD